MFYDGSALHADLRAADVVAVPEPHHLLQLVSGALFLIVAATRRGN